MQRPPRFGGAYAAQAERPPRCVSPNSDQTFYLGCCGISSALPFPFLCRVSGDFDAVLILCLELLPFAVVPARIRSLFLWRLNKIEWIDRATDVFEL